MPRELGGQHLLRLAVVLVRERCDPDGAVAAGRPAGRWADRFREPQPVVSNQPRAGRHHLGRAAVVVLERVTLERRVGGVEIDDPPNARAPPAVQRLVLVADREQLVLRRGQDADQQFLGGLDVLVLVDEHMVELLLPASAAGLVAAQVTDGQEDLVVEVVHALIRLVGLEQPVDLAEAAVLVLQVRARAVFLGRRELAELDRGDPLRKLGGLGRLKPDLVFGDPSPTRPLSDGRWFRAQVATLDERPDDAVADRVERACFDARHVGGGEPLPEFGRRRGVERQAQDPLWRRAAGEQLADAFDQHRGLAAARWRDDLHYASARQYGVPLALVQASRADGARPVARLRMADVTLAGLPAEPAQAFDGECVFEPWLGEALDIELVGGGRALDE